MYLVIALIVGVIIGQETKLPLMKPVVINLFIMTKKALEKASDNPEAAKQAVKQAGTNDKDVYRTIYQMVEFQERLGV